MHDRRALVHGVVAPSEDVVGERAVLAVGTGRAEKALPLPRRQHLPHHRRPVRGERARTAVHGAEHRLGAAQVVEGENESHVQHPRNEAGPAIVHRHLARDRADAPVAERTRYREQRPALDHAVGIDRDDDLAGRPPEAFGERAALAEVRGKADRSHQPRKAQRRALDVVPGIVGAAVVHGDDLQASVWIVRRGDPLAFVVRGNDDGERRRLLRPDRGERAIQEPQDGAQEKQQHAHRDPDDRRPHPQHRPVLTARDVHERLQQGRREGRPGEREHARENPRDHQVVPAVALRRTHRFRHGLEGRGFSAAVHRGEALA